MGHDAGMVLALHDVDEQVVPIGGIVKLPLKAVACAAGS
jgi:hypothetical protein